MTSQDAAAPGRDTFPVFGTTAVLLVTDPGRAGDARALADDLLGAVDRAASRFRPDSELSALNQAGGAATRVSPLLADLICAALRAARLTDGAVDPTCAAALASIGYDRDFEDVRAGTRRAPAGAAPVPGWRSVELDQAAGQARLRDGAALDLGATAKAWAADRCAELIAARLGCGVLVSLGGDIAVAGPAPGSGWRVRVTDDHAAGPDAPGQTVAISEGGLATSSTTVRTWRSGRRQVHHIIDPATGAPARSCWRTVSVAAGTCVDANTASTAAIVQGAAAAGWLRAAGLPARLVRRGGAAAAVAAARAGGAAARCRRRGPRGQRPAMNGDALVVTSSTPLWYTTRATGIVAMVLLTASMAAGLLSAGGYQRPGLPRFVTIGLHRNASLLALAFTAVHVLTTVTDGFVHIPVQDAFIPFIGSYRPLWLGLGTIAFDLMLALTATSLLRARLSYRAWRAVHWTSYACWPVALAHGLGTGTDTLVRWVLVLTVACIAVVAALAAWRLAVARRPPAPPGTGTGTGTGTGQQPGQRAARR